MILQQLVPWEGAPPGAPPCGHPVSAPVFSFRGPSDNYGISLHRDKLCPKAVREQAGRGPATVQTSSWQEDLCLCPTQGRACPGAGRLPCSAGNNYHSPGVCCVPTTGLLSSSDSFAAPMDCGSPGSSVHGIFQARILAWVATSSSRGSS